MATARTGNSATSKGSDLEVPNPVALRGENEACVRDRNSGLSFAIELKTSTPAMAASSSERCPSATARSQLPTRLGLHPKVAATGPPLDRHGTPPRRRPFRARRPRKNRGHAGGLAQGSRRGPSDLTGDAEVASRTVRADAGRGRVRKLEVFIHVDEVPDSGTGPLGAWDRRNQRWAERANQRERERSAEFGRTHVRVSDPTSGAAVEVRVVRSGYPLRQGISVDLAGVAVELLIGAVGEVLHRHRHHGSWTVGAVILRHRGRGERVAYKEHCPTKDAAIGRAGEVAAVISKQGVEGLARPSG